MAGHPCDSTRHPLSFSGIEKVYYISGSEQAETLWAEEYAKKGAPWSAQGPRRGRLRWVGGWVGILQLSECCEMAS